MGKGEKVNIAFNDRQAAFEIGLDEEAGDSGLADHLYLVSKIVEGNYPNYRQVIPRRPNTVLKLSANLCSSVCIAQP